MKRKKAILPKRLLEFKESGIIDSKTYHLLKEFYENYTLAIPTDRASEEKLSEIVETFFDMVVRQIQTPYPFDCYHQRETTPYPYYQFGGDLMRLLVDKERSNLKGSENLKQVESQLARGENAIFLANHQTEADPQAISILLEEKHPDLAEKIFYVAGERVLKDPLAAPFSMGCNLICIYSKKHIANPPEKRLEKQQHNRLAMQKLEELLREGGLCLYIAPSGGRDRPDENGKVDVAPFDAQSIEMLVLLSQKAKRPTHFYPLALSTYALLPPPHIVEKEIGETREVNYTPIHAWFGDEIEMESTPKLSVLEKKQQRRERAEAVWSKVCDMYRELQS